MTIHVLATARYTICMYFVNARKKLQSHTLLLHLVPTGAVLITMLILTLFSWKNATQAYNTERSASMHDVTTNVIDKITDRLDEYRIALVSAKALYAASNKVTDTEWQNYFKIINAKDNYAGLQGIGIAQHVPKNNASKRGDYSKEQGIYTSISIVNYAPKHSRKLGKNTADMRTIKTTSHSTEQIVDTTITNTVQFAKPDTPFTGTGFSMISPLHKADTDGSSPVTKTSNNDFVFADFLSNEVFQSTLNITPDTLYGVKIYDHDSGITNPIYSSTNFNKLLDNHALRSSEKLQLYGQEWNIDFVFSSDMLGESARSRPLGALVAGIALSVMLSGLVLMLLIARTKSLAHNKQKELQYAKDELLSLASHQLRTPATSVKQYIGMILEGYSGKVSRQQKALLKKAYESNERQLHIINDILYVAKIDAKGIVLTPRKLDINKLLRDLTQELSITAKDNHQEILLKSPAKPINIEADEHSLRMALENIINNALKYSRGGTKVLVSLVANKENVRIIVKDEGVGIDAEDISLLFQRFSRIPNELSRQSNGSGIGLYLSDQLVAMHKGSINVKSIKDKGTTFTITLPKIFIAE